MITRSCSKKNPHLYNFGIFLRMLLMKLTYWNVICSRAVFFLLLVVKVIDALNFIDSTISFTMGWNIFSGKNQMLQNAFFVICKAEVAQSLSSLQNWEFLKFIISLFHYFWCQNWDQWHKIGGKNYHIIFFYFWFKNKWVW